MVVSCPDAMAFVFDESQVKATKNDWKELAFSLQWENSYGYYGIGTKNGWTVEIYADNFEMPNSAEVTPTLVEFDDHLSETPLNPGLFARNSNAKKQFSKCTHPGHHACLDEFTADGNIQFEEGPASNS
ncbi:hypothetical protein EB796_006295 [Bugula neritina]|uniref:Uncharacterized protein n=1 Tax=Bugula neritina TaxID=10212 RepID=A0A7J7KB17_BUGNE|nr:hypothetical protein EB796_006295 [Bugula neritina]